VNKGKKEGDRRLFRPPLHVLPLDDLVGAHHVVVLVLKDVAVEGILLCTPHPWRQLKRRADFRHDLRVCGDRVLEAAVVRLQGQRPAGVEGRRIRVGRSPLTRLIERPLVVVNVEGAPLTTWNWGRWR
jgi:hypothetical protein